MAEFDRNYQAEVILRLHCPKYALKYINNNNIFHLSSKNANILQECSSIEDQAMFAVQAMLNSSLSVNLIDDLVCIITMACRKDNNLIIFGHFEEKGLKAEPFNSVDHLCLTVSIHLIL